MASPGTVNRTQLQSYYQNAGDVYDDAKTESAMNLMADVVDANYQAFAAYLVGFNRFIDGGAFTDTGVGNTYDGGTF